ncbi:MAG: MBL fold metallo-hydrolase [Bacteroidota bacterium]
MRNSDAPKRRLWLRVLGWITLALALLVAALTVEAWPALGAQAEGERLARVQQSPQYREGAFQNLLPQQSTGASVSVVWEFFTDRTPYKVPEAPLPTLARTAANFASPRDSLRITWFGHSSVLVELDSARVLIDPVWGERVSPSRFIGSRRFAPPMIPLDDLPPIDAVLISHDHYDHLDMPTVHRLAGTVSMWVVPLGLGAHLEHWGVPPARITELDWWETAEVGGLTLVSTPARHFSGRFLTDADATLWSGFAILGRDQRVWYSGDTALTPEFAEVGARYGPFDVTLVESGAYDAAWSDVHLGPEQAVAAHRMVRGQLLVPIHWAMFNLAIHSWVEPAERVLAAAEPLGIPVAVPRPGESLTPQAYPTQRWWPERPWRTATEAPAISTSLPDSVLALVP